jgi:hypothetical protein
MAHTPDNSNALDSTVRLEIYRQFVSAGAPLTVETLAATVRGTTDDVRASLRRLAKDRAIVLGPTGDSVWVAPPFSARPAPHWVETPSGSWWAWCAWEALAIPILLDTPAIIHTSSGAEGTPMQIEIRDGRAADEETVFHISPPMARWWDDVTYTCGTMVFFDSAAAVDAWCRRHNIPRGAIVTLRQGLQLSTEWFSHRLDADWRRLTPAAAAASLAAAGLHGPFWEGTRL